MVVALLAASALYLGAAFPNDLVAGVLLGVTVASSVHLVFGSPGSRPTTPQIAEALARLGVVAHDVQFAPQQPASSTLVLANDEQGPLRIRVVGRDEAHHQLLAKLWTSVVNKGSTGRFVLTREQEVEHEAYVMLVAAQGQVHVPTVVVAGRAGPRAALLVQRPVSGERLADLEVEAITDAVLRRLWRDVDAMGRSRVVHGDLDADHVIVRGGQPWIVGFDDASISADPDDRAADVADLLASTAALVGDERAVRAAVDGMGAAVARALRAPSRSVVTEHSQAERCRTPALRRSACESTSRRRRGHRDRRAGTRADPADHADGRSHGPRRLRRGRCAPHRRR